MKNSIVIDLLCSATSGIASTTDIIEPIIRDADSKIVNDNYLALSEQASVVRGLIEGLPPELSDGIDASQFYPHVYENSDGEFNMELWRDQVLKMHSAAFKLWREMEAAREKASLYDSD